MHPTTYSCKDLSTDQSCNIFDLMSIYSQRICNRYQPLCVCVFECVCVCVSVHTLWVVSEEDLSGTRDNVCSSAAELGHRRVERQRDEELEGMISCFCLYAAALVTRLLAPIAPSSFALAA